MKTIQKIVSKLFKILLPFIDQMAYLKYFNQPLTSLPISSFQNYKNLSQIAEKNTYSIDSIDILENDNGFLVDKDWLNTLAFNTQIVVKKTELNYAHGRVLYSVLRNYLSTLEQGNKSVNIIETGTALGFSSVCMAKALSDSGFEGSICTIDVIPHFKKMFWNCAADHVKGEQTRDDLLSDWADLVERYIIFIQGYTKHILPKIALSRINFAFLDGAHIYEDVLYEFNIISERQKKGDVVVFDDYNEKKFPGVVNAVKKIARSKKYDILIVPNKNTLRDYVIAKKVN